MTLALHSVFPPFDPELVYLFFLEKLVVNEVDTCFQFIFGRHIVFGLKGWNVSNFEANHMPSIFRRPGARRKALPRVVKWGSNIVVLVRLQGEPGVFCK